MGEEEEDAQPQDPRQSTVRVRRDWGDRYHTAIYALEDLKDVHEEYVGGQWFIHATVPCQAHVGPSTLHDCEPDAEPHNVKVAITMKGNWYSYPHVAALADAAPKDPRDIKAARTRADAFMGAMKMQAQAAVAREAQEARVAELRLERECKMTVWLEGEPALATGEIAKRLKIKEAVAAEIRKAVEPRMRAMAKAREELGKKRPRKINQPGASAHA